MSSAFITKNLWDYENINAVPPNLPGGLRPYYICDNKNKSVDICANGWELILEERYINIQDKKQRRSKIIEINCTPELYLPGYDYYFVVDSNIKTLPSNYGDFINKMNKDIALLIETGYYKDDEDNILMELRRSLGGRWRYDDVNMTEAVNRYLRWIENLQIDFRTVSVASMKYLAWNPSHPRKKEIAEFIISEGEKHLQGNIIISMLPYLFPGSVGVFRSFNRDVEFSPHNYLA